MIRYLNPPLIGADIFSSATSVRVLQIKLHHCLLQPSKQKQRQLMRVFEGWFESSHHRAQRTLTALYRPEISRHLFANPIIVTLPRFPRATKSCTSSLITTTFGMQLWSHSELILTLHMKHKLWSSKLCANYVVSRSICNLKVSCLYEMTWVSNMFGR